MCAQSFTSIMNGKAYDFYKYGQYPFLKRLFRGEAQRQNHENLDPK